MARILVVDDDKNIRALFAQELEEAGYVVQTAALAVEAIEKYRARRPDLMIVDIRMPDMSGLEMIQIIRELDTDVPIIIISALHALKDDFAVWESNVAAFLDKPIDLETLRGTVKRVLEESEK